MRERERERERESVYLCVTVSLQLRRSVMLAYPANLLSVIIGAMIKVSTVLKSSSELRITFGIMVMVE